MISAPEAHKISENAKQIKSVEFLKKCEVAIRSSAAFGLNSINLDVSLEDKACFKQVSHELKANGFRVSPLKHNKDTNIFSYFRIYW